ncbi:SRPBCC family protein [Pontivivens ytuae]|uniref:SRPBCC family protein n=1 Tax=Pontivivens ytuae TaxID=2789856 RepID=A0A7S9LTG5_9RHOB|nr:SRPBCC family protein [Pontivivens ytuae]QPH54836.1 SRPBCC family protein [Pontivivens ytuae]
MNLTATTMVDAPPQALFDLLNDPDRLAALTEALTLEADGDDRWQASATFQGREETAQLDRVAAETPERIAYVATARGLELTATAQIGAEGAGSALGVDLSLVSRSMKGKMMLQGLKLAQPQLEKGLGRLLDRLAREASAA